MRLFVLALLLLLSLSTTSAAAQSPLAAEARAFASRYHEDPARIDRLRAALTEAVGADPHVANLLALAEISFIWGDIRATTDDEKLAAYDQGREAARRAIERAPQDVVAHFWYATNTGRWGQTKGVTRSLFLLPTVKREIDTMLALDARFAPIYALAGHVYYEVPGLLGGDLDRAEQMFRTGLRLEPTFTNMRVGLAKTLAKRGRVAEARQELAAVLAERTPHNPATWTLKDAPEARALLATLGGGPTRDPPR